MTQVIAPLKPATKSDATELLRVYNALSHRMKRLKESTALLKKCWASGDVAPARENRDTAQMQLDTAMDEAWAILKAMPSNTNAPGGASPQTIALQFFDSNLNSQLAARITATEARKVNKRSFG